MKIQDKQYDVIIVGTGVAGLFAALSISPKYQILMVSKDKIENSDSYLAQGGICTLKEPSDFDSFMEDTLRAGRYENREETVRVMIENSPMIMQRLIKYGVEFDLKGDGSFEYTREGAHSTYRILHHKDVTGKEITNKLLNRVREQENITLCEYTRMVDLIIRDNVCSGVVFVHDKQVFPVQAKRVILATGGIGGLFAHSTNFRHITGDSFALALRHHIELENINYIQIHPTTLYEENVNRKFLISESVRGEGAILLNKAGERFVEELLPRDVVTEAIRKQMEKDGRPYVMLSIKHMPKDEIIRRFPNIYRHCLEVGYDLSNEDIPVTPAQHYLMGGIMADTYGRTSVNCLFAVGETACNGVHGANRLASNSLLESLVFSERAGWIITEELDAGASGSCLGKDAITDILSHNEAVTGKEQTNDTKKATGNAVGAAGDLSCVSAIALSQYEDIDAWDAANRKLIMDEIKRRDCDFYDKWCNA